MAITWDITEANWKLIWVWVNTYRYIFSGMNIHFSYFDVHQGYQGFDPSPFGSVKNWKQKNWKLRGWPLLLKTPDFVMLAGHGRSLQETVAKAAKDYASSWRFYVCKRKLIKQIYLVSHFFVGMLLLKNPFVLGVYFPLYWWPEFLPGPLSRSREVAQACHCVVDRHQFEVGFRIRKEGDRWRL